MVEDLVVIRFPGGDAEFDAGSPTPTVGDTIIRREVQWRVTQIDERVDHCVTISVIPIEVERDESWVLPLPL